MKLQEQFGERLGKLRKAKGYTQEKAAEILGVTNETLSRLERGAQWTEFAMLAKLASLYEVELSDLFALPSPGKGSAKRAILQEILDLLRGASLSDAVILREIAKTYLSVSRETKKRR